MTLIVSVRTAEGMVVAGDSVATLSLPVQLTADINVACPQCTHQHVVSGPVLGPPLPRTTFPYAQKVFPFVGCFGVGTAGWSQVAGRTIHFAIRELEQEIISGGRAHGLLIDDAAQLIGKRLHELFLKTTPGAAVDWKGKVAIQLQVVGYDKNEPKRRIVQIGADLAVLNKDAEAISVVGEKSVANALYTNNPEATLQAANFSLQDAVDFAAFLIRTTSDFQRFSDNIPTVGGEIDIAFTTPFDGFKWIQQKALGRILGSTNHGEGSSTTQQRARSSGGGHPGLSDAERARDEHFGAGGVGDDASAQAEPSAEAFAGDAGVST